MTGCSPDDPNGLDWRVFMRRGVLADLPHQGWRLGVAVGYLDVESHHALPHLERHRSCACTANALAAPVDPAAPAAIAAARAPTGSTTASPSKAFPAPGCRIQQRGCPMRASRSSEPTINRFNVRGLKEQTCFILIWPFSMRAMLL
jgi:hypothetical protein